MTRFTSRAMFVLVLICATIGLAWAQTPTKPLTIEALCGPGGLMGRGPENVEWSPDGSKLSFVERKGDQGDLWYMDAATGEKKILVSADKLASLAPDYNKVKNEREKERLTRYHVAAYNWAPDSKHLLFDSQGQLWLFDLGTSNAQQITNAPDPSGDPKFSPDGNRIAYVRKHNLYVVPTSGKGEKALTHDTADDLFNGDIDWVYAEELAVRSNYFWSPDGRDIAFLHMDETKVTTYPITDWMPRHPTVDNEKYPKVGDDNPSVKLGVVDTDKGKIKWFPLTTDEQTYIPRFGWVRDGVLWAESLNRTEDKMELYFIDTKSGKTRVVLTEETPGAWIEFDHSSVQFLKTKSQFLWPSWRDGNMHLYLYSFDKQNPLSADAKLEGQLTKGDFAVLGISGVDEQAGTAFVEANKDDPRQTQVFSVKLDGSGMTALTSSEGMHFADFSDDGKHYTHTYFGPTTVPHSELCAVGGACYPVWQAKDAIAEYGLRAPKYLDFKADDGTKLYGRLLLPPNADSTSGKIPVIVNIYGGPAGQTVRKGTPDAFDEILARDGFAIFSVDNRGTPGRDRKFQTAIRHEFGAIELKDQLAALDQLFAQYPQLDRDRTGIWGWSNGGSMTLYAMTHSTAFKAGVSVAPVTNQLNYDTIYTERYMGLMKEDEAGYGMSDVTKAAANLHGSLLLVHGTSDDNVHFQNSIQMINALIEAGKQFRLMIYPNKTHGIAGPAARMHLFHMIEDHFVKELK